MSSPSPQLTSLIKELQNIAKQFNEINENAEYTKTKIERLTDSLKNISGMINEKASKDVKPIRNTITNILNNKNATLKEKQQAIKLAVDNLTKEILKPPKASAFPKQPLLNEDTGSNVAISSIACASPSSSSIGNTAAPTTSSPTYSTPPKYDSLSSPPRDLHSLSLKPTPSSEKPSTLRLSMASSPTTSREPEATSTLCDQWPSSSSAASEGENQRLIMSPKSP